MQFASNYYFPISAAILGNSNVLLHFIYHKNIQLHTRAHCSIFHTMKQRYNSKLTIVFVGNPMEIAKNVPQSIT